MTLAKSPLGSGQGWGWEREERVLLGKRQHLEHPPRLGAPVALSYNNGG